MTLMTPGIDAHAGVARSPGGAPMLVVLESPNIYFDGLVNGKTVEQFMAEKAAETAGA